MQPVTPALASIPAFPPVALRVLQMLGDAEVSNRHLTEVMTSDPVFSGEILRCANSSLYRREIEILGLPRAVSALGHVRLRALAMTVATRCYMDGILILAELRPYRRYSLACALVAEVMARLYELREDQAYCAALFHDIGRLGLMAAHPKEYAGLLCEAQEQVRAGKEIDFDAEERARFGMDRFEAAAWLAEHWRLPTDMRAGISRPPESMFQDMPELTRIVYVSSRLVRSLGFGLQPELVRPDYRTVLTELPSWIGDRMPADAETLALELDAIIHTLDGDHAGRFETPIPTAAREERNQLAANPTSKPRRRVKWNWKVPTAALVALATGAMVSTASVAVLWTRR
jgi:HD-like signal output (HDOD) protein